MTANVMPADLAACRGAGMDDHIGKPFRIDELYRVLARWLETGKRRVRERAQLAPKA